MEQQIQRYIQDELTSDPERRIGLDDELLLEGLVDSLGVMRLVAFIEEHAGLTVPPEDVTIDHFRTVRILADYVRRRQAAARS